MAGTAKISLDGTDYIFKKGEAIDMPKETAHRIENIDSTQLPVFIEVQHGDYFGEDDIVRLEDDYNRTEAK